MGTWLSSSLSEIKVHPAASVELQFLGCPDGSHRHLSFRLRLLNTFSSKEKSVADEPS